MNEEMVTCANCGKEVSINEALSNFNLRDDEGTFVRFCSDCSDEFEQALVDSEEPIGAVFENIVVALGKRDPFFRIRFQSLAQGQLPVWCSVDPHAKRGGLLVFVRNVSSKELEPLDDNTYKCTIPVKITAKSKSVAFAHPVKLESKKAVEEVESIERTEDVEGN